MSDLQIARGLSLPVDAITRTFGILGQRGTGKTTTAVVLVEEMAKRGGHVAILDPVGAWWGVTRAGDGKGIPGIVIGGEHGDVPLEETGGGLVAQLVVERHWPVVVIDLKLLRKGAQLRFMADYLEELFQANRAPLHQVFEEADRALPQQARQMDPTRGRVIGAGEDIVKLGRSRGLGATLVTQRPATVNKNVLEQVEGLIVHRLLGPNDRKAIQSWVEANGDPAATKQVMDSLASMEVGEAWAYSPALGLLKKAKVRDRKTFDSSATPTTDVKAIEAQTTRAPVDLDELGARMADTVERAKANDPQELKRRIAALQQEIRDRPEPEPERVEVPVLDDEARGELRDIVGQLSGMVEDLAGVARTIDARLGKAAPAVPQTGGQASAPRASTPRPRIERPAPPPPPADGEVQLKAGARRMLETLVRISPVRVSKAQLATLVGMKVTGGTYNTYFSTLRRAGLIVEGSDRLLEPTDAGFGYLGEARPAPLTRDEVIELWRSSLKRGARKMLDILLERPGDWVGKDELADQLSMEVSGGTFNTYLSTLRRNGLAEFEGGMVRLGDAFDLVPA